MHPRSSKPGGSGASPGTRADRRGVGRRIALGALAAALALTAAAPAIATGPRQGRTVTPPRQERTLVAEKKGGRFKTVRKTFASDEAIAIADDTVAVPYPATITVRGFKKKPRISDVNVTLRDFNHEFPLDVDVMLVAPNGRNAVVMSAVGGNIADATVVNLTLELDDEAAAVLPEDAKLTSGSFRPLDAEDNPSDNFPAPAPAFGGADTLAAFDGINPNGQWRLFVLDEGAEDDGLIADGWELEVTAKSKVKGKKKR